MKASSSDPADRAPGALESADRRAGLDRADLPGLAIVLLLGTLVLVGFAWSAHRFAGGGGVPLDDAWIHFQFARNLARGDGFAFNPGEPTAGSTAPLWTVLLAGVYAVSGRFPGSAQVVSAASFLLVLLATYALARQVTGARWAGWLAGGVVAVNGRLAWAGLSALETCLFAALSLLAISSHLRDRDADRYRPRTAVLFGLAALARPEGVLLFALSLADALLLSSPGASTDTEPGTTVRALRIQRRILRLLPALGIFALLVLPYTVFSLCTTGHLLPNTFRAKTVFNFRPDPDFLSLASRYLILDNPLLLPFFVLGLGALAARAPVLPAWTVGLPLGYAFLHATLYQHGRYLIPLIPTNAVIAVAGLIETRGLGAGRAWQWIRARRAVAGLAVALILAATAWRLPAMARQFALDVDNINQMHVAIGNWVDERAADDALLALNDVGAIAYVSERRIIDLAGLVTPEVTPMLRATDTAARLMAFMAERGVDYVIIFPDWFPGLARRDDALEPVHRVSLPERTISGGSTMVVYRAHWPGDG